MGTGQQTEPLFHYLESKHAVLCLAFIGGFIDATGYVKLYGLFTSSITGNLVVGCAAMFGSGAGVFARVFVTLLFALGAFFTTIAATNLRIVLKKNQWETGIRLFCYEAVCLFVAMIFGIGVDFAPGGIPDIGSWQAIMVGSLLALSMGVHNAAAQDLIVNCPSTTVMTMTIIKTSMFAANAVQHWMAAHGLLLLHAPNEKPENYIETVTQKYQANFAKFIESVQPLIVFVIGAIFGAVMSLHMTFFCLTLPISVVVALIRSIQSAQRLHDPNLQSTVEMKDVEMDSVASPMAVQAEEISYEEEPVVVGVAKN